MNKMALFRSVLLATIGMLVLGGCGGSYERYLLSMPAAVPPAGTTRLGQIGVDKVSVPDYLSGTKIPVQNTKETLSYCSNAVWASHPEKGLSEHAIAYLQRRLGTPNVYRYPWEIERKQGLRVKIALSRFLYVAARNGVVLEASYFIEPLSGTRRISRLYRTFEPVPKGETPQIVSAMNRAYDRLLESIAQGIMHF
jgi:uncharacterized lipoprotein YmbA